MSAGEALGVRLRPAQLLGCQPARPRRDASGGLRRHPGVAGGPRSRECGDRVSGGLEGQLDELLCVLGLHQPRQRPESIVDERGLVVDQASESWVAYADATAGACGVSMSTASAWPRSSSWVVVAAIRNSRSRLGAHRVIRMVRRSWISRLRVSASTSWSAIALPWETMCAMRRRDSALSALMIRLRVGGSMRRSRFAASRWIRTDWLSSRSSPRAICATLTVSEWTDARGEPGSRSCTGIPGAPTQRWVCSGTRQAAPSRRDRRSAGGAPRRRRRPASPGRRACDGPSP